MARICAWIVTSTSRRSSSRSATATPSSPPRSIPCSPPGTQILRSPHPSTSRERDHGTPDRRVPAQAPRPNLDLEPATSAQGREYEDHHNEQRTHRYLEQASPLNQLPVAANELDGFRLRLPSRVRGVINEYTLAHDADRDSTPTGAKAPLETGPIPHELSDGHQSS